MQLENMSREQLMELARKHEKELAEAHNRAGDAVKKWLHWEGNHRDVVKRLKLATERPDLPVDRIPAIKEMERLQQELAEARAAMVAIPLVSYEELAQQGGGELTQDERAAFERHMISVGADSFTLRRNGIKGGTSYYGNQIMQDHWEVWQARAALAQRVASVPNSELARAMSRQDLMDEEFVQRIDRAIDALDDVDVSDKVQVAESREAFFEAIREQLGRIVRVSQKPFSGAASVPAQAEQPEPAKSAAGLVETFNTVMWLYRRLPRAYGRPPHVDRAVAALAKKIGTDVEEYLSERDEIPAASVQPDIGRDAALVKEQVEQYRKGYRHGYEEGKAEVASVEPVAVLSDEQIEELHWGEMSNRDLSFARAVIAASHHAPSAPAAQVQTAKLLLDCLDLTQLVAAWAGGSKYAVNMLAAVRKLQPRIKSALAAAPAQPAAPNPQDAVDAALPGDWTLRWDNGSIRLHSPKWGGVFLDKPSEIDSATLKLNAIIYPLLVELLAARTNKP